LIELQSMRRFSWGGTCDRKHKKIELFDDEPEGPPFAPAAEPAHEALLRQWGELERWLAEDFGSLAALEGLQRAGRDWEAKARDPAWATHGGARKRRLCICRVRRRALHRMY
jgi:hypothetical protein